MVWLAGNGVQVSSLLLNRLSLCWNDVFYNTWGKLCGLSWLNFEIWLSAASMQHVLRCFGLGLVFYSYYQECILPPVHSSCLLWGSQSTDCSCTSSSVVLFSSPEIKEYLLNFYVTRYVFQWVKFALRFFSCVSRFISLIRCCSGHWMFFKDIQ